MEKDLAPKMIDRALGFFTIKAMKILSYLAPTGDMFGDHGGWSGLTGDRPSRCRAMSTDDQTRL